MRCRDDANIEKSGLDDQREDTHDASQTPLDPEYSPARDHDQHRLESVFQGPTPLIRASISTDRIMHAIQQQRHVTQQLEDIQQRQRTRVEQLRPVASIAIATGMLLVSSIPLFCFAVFLFQTDMMAYLISILGGVLDICMIIVQYLQSELTVVTHNTFLLSGLAFTVVVMMGMWLRLMRPPREV